MTRYEFAEQFQPQGITAQAAGERCEELLGQHDLLTPKIVVEDARPADAILHPAFEWDDPMAAELYREWQARMLVKSIRIVQIEDNQPCAPHRAFINVITQQASRGYLTSAQVMRDEVLREQVLLQAKRDLKAWRARYKDLEELGDIYQAIDRFIDADTIAV